MRTRGHILRFAHPPEPLPEPGPPPVARVIGAGDTGITLRSLRRQTLPAAEGERDWTLLVDAGYALDPAAVSAFARAIAAVGADADVVTCDRDHLSGRGRRRAPHLSPGPSPDLLASRPAASPVLAARTTVLAGHDTGADGWRRRMLLEAGTAQAHLPQILAHAAPEVAQPAADVRSGDEPRPALDAEPSVEAIVCLRDRPELLEVCARTLMEVTAYDRLTLRVVDNASAEPVTAALLGRLARHPRVIVERDDGGFNFSRLNHAAACRSDADVLLFLNNDTEVRQPDWLERLLAHALRPEVGAVAPLLTYRDGRVQHAGVVVGLHGWAGHPFAGLHPAADTPFGSAAEGVRNCLAVTAACLAVERRKYAEVGGFDDAFAVGGGDVDLGLRLTAAGYRSLCVTGARMVHDESATRDPGAIPVSDYDASRRSYGAFRTVGDPFYNPALTLQDTTCRLRRAGEPPPPA